LPGYSIVRTDDVAGSTTRGVASFSLSDKELEFLGAHLGPDKTAFEWGSGMSTAFLATRCRRVTTVEHQAPRAAEIALGLYNAGRTNVAVYCIPPDFPYVDGGDDDGDLATFRSYVQAYTGLGVDVVLIDGRARCAAARWIAERAPFGPHPSMKIFCHDADRPALAAIWTDTTTEGGIVDGVELPLLVPRCFDMVETVERLALLRMKEG